MTFGEAVAGVSPSLLLQQQRRAAAAAAAPSNGCCGQSLNLALIVADESPHGKADPAFAAHLGPVGEWAQAVWESWMPMPALQRLISSAQRRLTSAARPWSVVRGPGSAVVATAWRLGWDVPDARRMVTDTWRELLLDIDPSIAVARECEAAVSSLEMASGRAGCAQPRLSRKRSRCKRRSCLQAASCARFRRSGPRSIRAHCGPQCWVVNGPSLAALRAGLLNTTAAVYALMRCRRRVECWLGTSLRLTSWQMFPLALCCIECAAALLFMRPVRGTGQKIFGTASPLRMTQPASCVPWSSRWKIVRQSHWPMRHLLGLCAHQAERRVQRSILTAHVWKARCFLRLAMAGLLSPLVRTAPL